MASRKFHSLKECTYLLRCSDRWGRIKATERPPIKDARIINKIVKTAFRYILSDIHSEGSFGNMQVSAPKGMYILLNTRVQMGKKNCSRQTAHHGRLYR